MQPSSSGANATPTSGHPRRAADEGVNRLALKTTALCVVELALLTIAGICGIIMQTIAGYYHYELLQYAKELYVVTFPQVLIFALFAMFVQTIVSNKFIGHGIVIGLFVMQPVLFNFGWENTLYLFGNSALYLLRYERLRTFRPTAILVDYILAFGGCLSRCPLDRTRPPRSGRLLPRTLTLFRGTRPGSLRQQSSSY